MLFEDISDDYISYCDAMEEELEDTKLWDRTATDSTSDVDKLVADFMKYWRNNS